MTRNLNIKQDMQNQMFFVKVQGGIAYLKYEKPDTKILDYRETYVPKSSRHKGVATELVAHAMEYAEAKNYKVNPSCPFVQHYLKNKN